MTIVTTGEGLDLAVNEYGPPEGPPVLLLAGTAMEQMMWAAQVSALSDTYRVVTFDSRDVGGSARAAAPYDTAQLADDAAAVLEASGIGSAHVVGVSLGGCVAQQLALRRPELVRSVCTTSTWARTDAHLRAQFRFWIDLAERAGWAMVFRLMSFQAFSSETLEMLADVIDGMGEAMAATFELEPFRRQVLADLGHNLEDADLASITAPFLSLWGTEDLLVRRRHAEQLGAGVKDGRFDTIPGVSHSVMADHPERFNAILLEWLAAHTG